MEMEKENGNFAPAAVQKRLQAFFWGIILIAAAVLVILKRDFFFAEQTDYSSIITAAAANDAGKIRRIREIDIRPVFMAAVIFLYFLYRFFSALFWKIEYGDDSFCVKHERAGSVPYEKISSIVHYTAHRYRKERVDVFLIFYRGIPEFGYKEEVLKITIDHYPHTRKMKSFFSFVRKKNPKIDFRAEHAGSSGTETSAFDYFAEELF